MYVYLITNTANGKAYIGQHAGNDLDAYLRHNIRHALCGIGNKTYLYRAVRKYGSGAFSIQPLYKAIDKPDMDSAEIAFIRLFGTTQSNLGYNITAGGGGRLGTKNPHTAETKEKIGRAHKGKAKTEEWKANIRAAQKGRPLSDSHRAALKGSHGGAQKISRSPEHCLRIAENKRKWWAMRKQEVARAA